MTELYNIWNQFYTNVTTIFNSLIIQIENGERITIDTGVYYN